MPTYRKRVYRSNHSLLKSNWGVFVLLFYSSWLVDWGQWFGPTQVFCFVVLLILVGWLIEASDWSIATQSRLVLVAWRLLCVYRKHFFYGCLKVYSSSDSVDTVYMLQWVWLTVIFKTVICFINSLYQHLRWDRALGNPHLAVTVRPKLFPMKHCILSACGKPWCPCHDWVYLYSCF